MLDSGDAVAGRCVPRHHRWHPHEGRAVHKAAVSFESVLLVRMRRLHRRLRRIPGDAALRKNVVRDLTALGQTFPNLFDTLAAMSSVPWTWSAVWFRRWRLRPRMLLLPLGGRRWITTSSPSVLGLNVALCLCHNWMLTMFLLTLFCPRLRYIRLASSLKPRPSGFLGGLGFLVAIHDCGGLSLASCAVALYCD